MRAAVVTAHPSTDSFCHELARRAVSGLVAAGHDVEILDLYEVGFRPAMSGEERRAYHGEQPILDPVVAEHAAVVRRSELLVFVYPTWWGGLPAMLKGWLDRVMVPGVAFEFDPRSEKVRPALGHVRRIVGVSTYGSPRTYVLAINDGGRRMLTRALRLSCGLRTRATWLGLYSIDTASDVERREFAASVERRLADLR
jgi:NAD(P)H dehydrogenase (quinone)